MNTKVVKSFGLALLVAVGVLALMLALGTFTSQKAGAQETTGVASDISIAFDDHAAGTEDVELTVKFTPSTDIDVDDEIRLFFVGFGDIGSATGNISGTSTSGAAVTGSVFEDTDAAIDSVSPVGDVLSLTVDDTDTTNDATTQSDDGFSAGEEITLVFLTEIDLHTTAQNVQVHINYGVATGNDPTADSPGSGEVGIGVVLTADPQTPGSTAYVTVEVGFADGTTADNATLIVGTRLAFDMGSFGVPSSIDTDDVTINGLAADGTQIQVATAASVVVSGKKVTVRVPDMNPEDTSPDALSPHYEIVFVQAAGISVPSTAGSYTIKATLPGSTTEIESDDVTVEKSLSLDKKSGATGTMVTVTGKGFERDINTLFIDTRTDTTAPNGSPDNDEYIIASGIDVDNGSFKETFTIDSNFETGLNYINTLDVQGNSFSMVTDEEQAAIDAEAPAEDASTAAKEAAAIAQAGAVDAALEDGWVTFNLTGIMTLDKTSVRLGDNIEITLANFSDGGVTSYKIGNKDLIVDTEGDDAEDLDVDNGSATFTATVPPDLTIGKHQVRVTVTPDGGGDKETGSVEITVEGLPLTISPSTAVPGQEVTIRGTGFTAEAALATIEIGGKEASLGSVAILANNSGRIVATITIPKTVSATGANVLVVVTENNAPVT